MSHIDSGLPVASANFLASGAARAAGFDMTIHPTCCGIAAATSWRTTASIYEPSKAIWATSRSSTPSDTPSWRRRALRAYFGISMQFDDSQKPAGSFYRAGNVG